MKSIPILIVFGALLLCAGCARNPAERSVQAAGKAEAAPVRAAPAAIPIPAMAVSESKPEAAAQAPEKPVKKKACDCESAETELPETCPDESCRVCKASCGIPGH